MLEIKNLKAEVDGKEILKGLNLKVNPGEVHAIMGPNGSGKSSLSKVISGHPSYTVTDGEILFDVNFEPKNIIHMEPDERAKEGIFLAFQYPVEVPGVSNFNFLMTSFNSVLEHQGSEPLTEDEFRNYLKKKMEIISLRPDFLERGVNSGFSGGEKKKNEILQMAVLAPRLSILDETDSGLDIDALKVVSEGVNKIRSKNNAIVLITHYQRLLDYIKPDFIHVLYQGRIVKTGGPELALELEKNGYDGFLQ
ncbi:MAG: Fe-S cluster assembly ATPase SufC [Bdellovibrionaceae bacterium]|nr:Fe-S cluster assembly ATPase SufC [Pseudobdellovibrionaceae bacterium]